MEYYRLLPLLLATALALPAAPRLTYRVDTVAGSSRMGDGGPAAGAQFGSLQGVAADRVGNLYVSDADYHRIRKISAAGIVSTIAGTSTAGYGGDGGPAVSAQLNLPYGLAVDAAGYLYIADLGNQRVRRISPEGIIVTVAGNGQKGTKGDDGPATEAQLMSPRNLAVDSAGVLYISEFEGHRVRRVTTDGRISTVAGTGVAGFSGDGFAARTAQLGFPAGLAVDRSGALYVCDSQNSRVRKIVPGGAIVTVLGGAPGTSLLTPIAVAVDGYGTIYVGDRSASVRQYSVIGAWSTTAGTGLPGFAGDNGPAPKALLSAVHDLAMDITGSLLIADGARIRRVNNQGVIATVAGDGYLQAIGDGGPAAAATLLQPSGITVDSTGNVWFADPGMHRVRRINTGGQMATAAGTGAAGFDANQLAATLTPLDTPTGTAIMATGELLIADTANQRIRRVGLDGRIRTVTGTGTPGSGPEWVAPDQEALRAPRGVCADRAGVVYAADTSNQRVVRVPASGLVSNAAGNGAAGDSGDGGWAQQAQLNLPSGCAVDSSGYLYIADTSNHRIRRVDPAGVITTVAGTGSAGFSGDGAAAVQARLYAPRAVAVDSAGSLYIADTGNHRIRKVDTDGVINTIAGRDLPGFSGDGGPATDAQLNAPEGVAVDGTGAVWVSDTGNNRIRKLTPEALPPEPVILPPQIAVANAASLQSGPLSPGELVVITGTGLGPENGVKASFNAAGLLENLVAEAEVLFDGAPASLFYVQAAQITAQVPYSVTGKMTTIEVRYRKQSRGVTTMPVIDAAPALFASPLQADGSLNAPDNPAARASVVTFFATGEGLTDGPNVGGLPAGPPYAKPRMPVSLRIAGVDAEILYAAAAPNLVGILQIDARVPAGFIAPGAAPVVLAVGPYLAPAFTLWIK